MNFRKKKEKKGIASTFLAVLLMTGFSFIAGTSGLKAQENYQAQELANRLGQMDRQIQTLSQAVFKNGIIPDKSKDDYKAKTIQYSSNPDIEVRLSQLEREIRALTGRIETQAHKISELENRFKSRINDLEMQIQDLGPDDKSPRNMNDEISQDSGRDQMEATSQLQNDRITKQNGQGQQRQNNNQTLGQVGTSSMHSLRLPIEKYEQAFATLKQGDYDRAEKQFREFIQENEDHRLVSNARYWLGETYYVREDYEQAARAFARGYKENPSGAKAPDNLLKLGLSLNGLGNREDACVALIQLTQKFEDGPRPVLNRASQEIERLDCAR